MTKTSKVKALVSLVKADVALRTVGLVWPAAIVAEGMSNKLGTPHLGKALHDCGSVLERGLIDTSYDCQKDWQVLVS